MNDFAIQQQNFPTLELAKAALPADMPILSFPAGSMAEPNSAHALAKFIQGNLENSTVFLIPWSLISMAQMALFNAPLHSSEVIFLAEPAYRKAPAAIISRRLSEPSEPLKAQ